MSHHARMTVKEVRDYEDRDSWLAARLGGIGASESAALFNLNPYQSRFSLWLQKTRREPPWEPTGDQAERMEWGHRLEPVICDVYAERTKRELSGFSRYCIATHGRLPIMFATPDRLILSAPDRPGMGTLQAKNTANLYSDEGWRDGVPMYVQIQVQHELAVTGLDFAAVVALANGNHLMTWDIPRDDDFIAELELQVVDFWDRFVLADKQPPVDGHSATLDALKRLHPLDNGETIELPAEAARWWSTILLMRKIKARADKRAATAEAELRAAMGPNTFGKLTDGRFLSFKTVENAGYTPPPVAPYKYRVLRETTERKAAAITSPKKKKGSHAA